VRKLAGVWVALLVGCGGGPDSQESYRYAGCEPNPQYCPNLLTLYCAAEALRAPLRACTADEDCVAANIDNRCTGLGSCGDLVVAASSRAQFEAALQAEIDRYCAAPLCQESGSCAGPVVPRCVSGLCTGVLELPDAGA
jgi:hypothetical protein